jgi:uroporphyrinogen decarboxylase
LQPIRRFDFDAAILFSDILVLPEALGQTLSFDTNHGPVLTPAISDDKLLHMLHDAHLESDLGYVAKAIHLIRKELQDTIPLIGFCGSPFTLATYMIEGRTSKVFKQVKTWMYGSPQTFMHFLDKLTEAIVRYLRLQINAGVEAVQIFDTWGSVIPIHLYHQFSGQFLSKIVEQLQPAGVPIILFTRGGLEYQEKLITYHPAVLSLDWSIDIDKAYKTLYKDVALQGNLDPSVLYGSRDIIEHEVMRILNVFGKKSGHIFNLGHGILPDIPLWNVEFLVETVKIKSEELHR